MLAASAQTITVPASTAAVSRASGELGDRTALMRLARGDGRRRDRHRGCRPRASYGCDVGKTRPDAAKSSRLKAAWPVRPSPMHLGVTAAMPAATAGPLATATRTWHSFV